MLRLGIVVRTCAVQRWHVACVEQLRRVASAHIVAIIAVDGPRNGRSKPSWLWSTAERALRPVLAASAQLEGLDGVSRLSGAIDERLALVLPGERQAAVAALGLDVLLDLTGECGRCDPEVAPEYWTFDYRMPLAFWETLRGEDTIEAALLGRSHRGVATLRAGRFKTAGRSYAHIARHILLELATWPALAAQARASGAVPRICGMAGESSVGRRISPNAPQTTAFLARLTINSVAARIRPFVRHEQWNVGLIKSPIESLLGLSASPAVQWLKHPARGTFIADPFGAAIGRTTYIFCEDFSYVSNKGSIACIELDETFGLVRRGTAIEAPVHLSYPFVFEWQDRIYCVPESYQRRAVTLYIARSFPWHWEMIATLVEGFAALDSTLFQHDGLWWLFCSNQEDGTNDKLYAFYGSALEGPWRPHPLNPIKTDVCSSRPGGTPFVHQGDLYRPAQDCSHTYGGRIVINKVVSLNLSEFCEEPAAVLEPDRNGRFPDGLHTLSKVGDLCVVDGKRQAFFTSGFVRALRQYQEKKRGKRDVSAAP